MKNPGIVNPHTRAPRRRQLLTQLLGIVLIGAGLVMTVGGGGAVAQSSGKTIAVTPSTGLNAGDTVQVAVAGFTANRSITIRQCPTGFSSGSQCQNAAAVTTDADGAANLPYLIAVTTFCNASTPCVLAGFNNNGDSSPAQTPLSFTTSATTTTEAPTTTSTLDPNATTTSSSTTTSLPPPPNCPIPDGDDLRFSGGTSADRAFSLWSSTICQPGFAGTGGLPLDYTGRSSPVGREDMLEGFAEVAVTGANFTDDDVELMGEVTEAGDVARTPEDFVFVPITASGLACMFNIYYLNSDANFARLPELHIDRTAMAGLLANERSTLGLNINAANTDNPWFRRNPDGSPVSAFVETLARAEGAEATRSLTDWIYSDPAAASIWETGGPSFGTGVTEFMPAGFGANLIVGAYRSGTIVRSWDIEKDRPGGKLTCLDSSIWRAEGGGYNVAQLTNALGQNVYPLPDNIRRGLDLMKANPNGTFSTVHAQADGFTDPQAYPLPIVMYAVVPRYLSVGLTDQIQGALTWMITDGQQSPNLPDGYVPLPDRMVDAARVQIAKLDELPAPSTTSTTTPSATSTTAAPTGTGTGSFNSTGSGSGSSSGSSSGRSSSGLSSNSNGSSSESAASPLAATGDGVVDVPGAASKPVLAVLSGDAALSPVMLILLGMFLLLCGPVVARLQPRRVRA